LRFAQVSAPVSILAWLGLADAISVDTKQSVGSRNLFWKKRGNISPKMVDKSVSTEARSTCDVATITEDMIVAGEMGSYEAAPRANYNEEYAHETPPEEYAEWCNIYGLEAEHFAQGNHFEGDNHDL